MSGDPKTLWEMTPREAWEHAWEQAIDTCRVFEEEATAGRLEVVRSIGRQFLDQDAGVRVVARDEAAELKAAGKKWAEALVAESAAQTAAYAAAQRDDGTFELRYEEWRDARDQLGEAEATLYHLVTGRKEQP